MSNAPFLLEASGLERRYTMKRRLLQEAASVKALDGVSFTLARGETLAVVGE